MDAAQTIRDAIADVTALRLHRTGDPALGAAVGSVKTFQARRFRGTYADLMASPAFGPAAQFFLEELYSDTDYTDRDLQFGRIAGTLQTIFPQPVVNTAVALAVLHAQTEELDQDMGRAWLAHEGADAANDAALYTAAWRTVGQRHADGRPRQPDQLHQRVAPAIGAKRVQGDDGHRQSQYSPPAPALEGVHRGLLSGVADNKKPAGVATGGRGG